LGIDVVDVTIVVIVDVVGGLVVAAFVESGSKLPNIIGGRYGLSSKEFTPAMVKAVFAELSAAKPRRRFTVGIDDDVTHLSLPYDESFSIEEDDASEPCFTV
jgi:pyruvate-ferredoxin/flavodoxin oxidoreductase